MNLAKLLGEHEQRRADDRAEIEAALYACGWRSSSALPGSLWLWGKSFPESKTQWRWKGRGEDRRKVPSEPFTIKGATLETAIAIEAAWQTQWDDNRPRPRPTPLHTMTGAHDPRITGSQASHFSAPGRLTPS